MKKLPLNNLWAVLLVGLLWATYVSAQTNTLEIRNDSGEKRKICMYKDADLVGVVPYRCFVMNRGETVTWNREGAYTPFKVKVFKSQLVDKFLFSQRLEGSTTMIYINEGRIRFSTQEESPTKYRLKVCNQRFNQEIYFALGFATPRTLVTEGWWSVAKGKCVEIGVSESLKRIWNVEYGSMPNTYIYAESYGSKPLYWRGGDSTYNFYINDRKAFNKNQFESRQGKSVRTSCSAEDEKLVKFRRMGYPKVSQEYYYLTF